MRVKELNLQISALPEKPGVYIFKDGSGQCLYVGKAKNIKKRVKAHFTRPAEPRLEVMLQKVAQVDYLVTKDEKEALILEYNLIKSDKPMYNVLYRDDKSYPYLAITLGDEWPRLFLTRNLNIEKARYFGPYPNTSAARKVVDSLLKIFPLRSCRGEKPGKRGNTPCLFYDIGKCSAPCINAVSKETYMEYVTNVVKFLEGKNDAILKEFEKNMYQEAKKLNFEKAAFWREKLKAANYILSHQRVVLNSKKDIDVFGIYSSEETYVKILKVRGGRLVSSRGFVFSTLDTNEALETVFEEYYLSQEDIPGEIVIPEEISERDTYQEILSERKGEEVRIITPGKGFHKDLAALAKENAVHSYYWYKFQERSYFEMHSRFLEDVKETLHLRNIPLRIECFDVSTFRGKSSVGSMVVFEDGKPKKSDYRKFKIRSTEESDFQMMKEILLRRIKEYKEKKDPSFGKKPDLIIVDGGKPQLSAAKMALKEAGEIGHVDLLALAKKDELVYLPGRKNPLRLPEDSDTLKLLKRIRNESHRFAVSYHRKLEEKKLTESLLDKVPGIGKVRKKKLLAIFGDIEGLKRASLEELKSVLPAKVAVELRRELENR